MDPVQASSGSAAHGAAGPRCFGLWTLTWVLGALALAGFGFTLGDFFLSDDFAGLAKSQSATGLWDAASPSESFSQMWVRPLPNWLWWGNYQVFGLDPFGYRLCNLLLHLLNAVLLARLASLLTGERWSGLFAAALFTVSPMHPEAVTWVSGRYDLLCATGVFGALLAWVRYLGPRGHALHLTGALVGATVALLSKEMALSLPLLAAAIAWGWFRPLGRRALVGLGCLAVVTSAYLALRWWLLDGVGGIDMPHGNVTTSLRGARLAALWDALSLSVLPTLRMRTEGALAVLAWVPPLLLALGWAAGLREQGAPQRIAALGARAAALFALALVPVASWATFWGGRNTRFLYLPAAFACLGLASALPRQGKRLAATVAGGLLLANLGGLLLTNRHWHEAAIEAQAMVESLPLVEPQPRALSLTRVPAFHGDAHLFFNGLHLALQLYRDFPGRTRILEPDDWEARRAGLPARQAQRTHFRWQRESAAWISEPWP